MLDLTTLEHGVLISCQAPEGSPLRDPYVMMRMAQAAEQVGAVGIRAEGVVDIAAIMSATTLPVIGIKKRHYPGSDVYITATEQDIDLIAGTGAQIVAVDATPRQRPSGQLLKDVVARAHEHSMSVMADLLDPDDASYALDAGADILGTTLVPAGAGDIRESGPNIDAVSRLARTHPSIPVIAEGRYATPQDIRAAFDAGAYAVVVGRAVTDSRALAHDLVAAAADGEAERRRVHEI